MRQRLALGALVVISLLALGFLAGRLVPRRPAATISKDPMAVAKAYFAYLHDGQVDEARKLAWFESDRARQEWEKQVQGYAPRLKEGERKSSGQLFEFEELQLPGTDGLWAVAEAHWDFGTRGTGTSYYAYPMREIAGEWKMAIDEATIGRAVPVDAEALRRAVGSDRPRPSNRGGKP